MTNEEVLSQLLSEREEIRKRLRGVQNEINGVRKTILEARPPKPPPARCETIKKRGTRTWLCGAVLKPKKYGDKCGNCRRREQRKALEEIA